MGEGTNRVNVARTNGEPRKMAREIESEITEIRSRLDRGLAELDRRRHELTDVRLQVRRHPMIAVGAGVLVVALVGGVAYAVWASRQRQKPLSKAARLREAFSRMADKPHKVAKSEPTVPEKILAAVGTAAATMLTKKLMERAFSALKEQPGDRSRAP
ncbi:MAG TPA: hypothetical protein VG496_19000 [Myxococcales bacterium]|nr:hypothetical protein [Myxococcales bacterium]